MRIGSPLKLNYEDPATPVRLPLAPGQGPSELGDGDLTVRRSVLPGGIRLITEQQPGNLSTSIGFWFEVGSRDEGESEAGASHFVEHLLFKGTPDRTAFQIAESFDAVGAVSNASTSKEATNYWSHMVATDMDRLLPVLVDMVTDSKLDDRDVEVERSVILDELAMRDDSPQDVAGETYARALYGAKPLGRPVGGTTESVESLTANQLRGLYRSKYGPSNLVVAVAGSVDHNQIERQLMDELEASPWVSRLFEGGPQPKRNINVEHPVPFDGPSQLGAAEVRSDSDPSLANEITLHRDVEQAHIITGAHWMGALDPRQPVSALTMNILGGGMSSRLFQEIREKRGLAYSTYSYAPAYFDTGFFGLYSGCAPQNLEEVEKLLWAEVEKLASSGPTDWELQKAKGQMRGAITLNLEDSGSRMVRLARSEMAGQFIPIVDGLKRVDAVTAQDVQAAATMMIESPKTTAVVTSNE